MIPRPEKLTDKELYEQWLRVNGMQLDFPTLREISDRELDARFFRERERESESPDRIPKYLGELWVNVVVGTGQGCSTLCRFVRQSAQRDCLTTRRVPIEVDLGGFWKDPDKEFRLEETVRHGLLKSLINEQWEYAGLQKDYFNLLGYKARDDEARPTYTNIARAKSKLQPLVNGVPPNWWGAVVACTAFSYSRPLREILAGLRKHSIVPLLFFDIPWDVPSPRSETPDWERRRRDLLAAFWGMVRAFLETIQLEKSPSAEAVDIELRQAPIHLVFFLTNDAARQGEAMIQGTPERIPFAPYSASETSQILVRHHGLKTVRDGQVRESLFSLLSGSFMELSWAPDRSLNDIMDRLKQEIVRALRQHSYIPVGLELSPDQETELAKLKEDRRPS